MTPDFPYVQLPGSYRGFLRKASLWEGIDHILSVKGTRFNEEYRRFYFRDIQAVIVENRPRWGSLGWWIILLILLFIASIAAAENDPHYSWVALLLLVLVLIVRLHMVFSRSCRCSLQTAVSREELPSVLRRSAAEALIRRLETRIAMEQGNLPAEIPQQYEDIVGTVNPPDANLPAASEVLEQAGNRERRATAVRGVNFAVLALLVLLVNSVFTFYVSSGERQISPQTASWIGYAFIAIGLIPVVMALQQIGGLRALRGLRAVLVSTLVLGLLRVFISFAIGPITVSLFRTRGANFVSLFQRYYVNANGALQMTLAAGGLLLIFAKWDTYRRGEKSSV
jgi:hypothetical protein